ncbi:MAG: hypothetical protein JWM56_1287 [Candidatus Peribacteria bacterium]|nr:hypothetical protein [Candidatus Peribacteria bacterium]
MTVLFHVDLKTVPETEFNGVYAGEHFVKKIVALPSDIMALVPWVQELMVYRCKDSPKTDYIVEAVMENVQQRRDLVLLVSGESDEFTLDHRGSAGLLVGPVDWEWTLTVKVAPFGSATQKCEVIDGPSV